MMNRMMNISIFILRLKVLREASYTVPTDVITKTRSFYCEVTYAKDGKRYSGKSDAKYFRIYPEKVGIPVIEEQPQNIQHVLGKQEIVQLEITLEKNEEVKITQLDTNVPVVSKHRGRYRKGNIDSRCNEVDLSP